MAVPELPEQFDEPAQMFPAGELHRPSVEIFENAIDRNTWMRNGVIDDVAGYRIV